MSANNSVSNEEDWLVDFNKPIKTGKGKKEIIKDYKLERYICYLIVQNADSNKESVSLCKTYFAIQTRKQELYSLNQTAKRCVVKNFDKFHNSGYRGLYNGKTANDIAKRKKLRYREDILDNMEIEELAANPFRINQTKQRLLKDNVQGDKEAKNVHYEVGKKVRKAIADIGGMMPEEMPTPEKSLKEVLKSRLKKEGYEVTTNCSQLKI